MSQSRHRWFVVIVFFAFMLLHQTDRLLIGPLTSQIMGTFHINEAQMGAVSTGALIVAGLLYPVWGYLSDRYSRSKLLALASFIWGSTTWLSALAPTFGTFLATRASTGIDDSSYPGLYSLISDYFGPEMRGKIYGILQLAQPLGYMLGMLLGLFLSGSLGWRGIYYLTGSLGILLSIVLYFGVREAPRGKSEPELRDLEQVGVYRFELSKAKGLFRKRSLILLFLQGFFGVFPWNTITYWFFRYLETERAYSETAVFSTMAVAVLVLAGGYFVGGAVGDWAFQRSPRGRVVVSMAAVFLGAVMLVITMAVPIQSQTQFMILLSITALFIPIAAPNVIATVYDVTLPEVRSTALAVQYFIEQGGTALAPLMAGVIAVRYSLHSAILWICVSTWLLCGLFFAGVAVLLPKDIATLRAQMSERAQQERAAQAAH
jgi:MFS transporter, Spinster family, sphingosine-1-phosphate transporter